MHECKQSKCPHPITISASSDADMATSPGYRLAADGTSDAGLTDAGVIVSALLLCTTPISGTVDSLGNSWLEDENGM